MPAGRAGRFVSARGVGVGQRVYSFEEAVLTGWADDGGMILPMDFPPLTPELLQSVLIMV